jgi:hypothetical protein
VKYSANEWPAKLPTQENGNDTRNLSILSKDIEQSVQIVNTIPYDIRSTDNNSARYNQILVDLLFLLAHFVSALQWHEPFLLALLSLVISV